MSPTPWWRYVRRTRRARSRSGAWPRAFGKKPPKRLVELAGGAALAGWSYAINLVIDAAAVPEGMAPVVLGVVDPASVIDLTPRTAGTVTEEGPS